MPEERWLTSPCQFDDDEAAVCTTTLQSGLEGHPRRPVVFSFPKMKRSFTENLPAMIKNRLFSFLFILVFLRPGEVKPASKPDSLETIFQIKNEDLRERKMILYLRSYFNEIPLSKLSAAKSKIRELLESYQIKDGTGIDQFIEAICEGRFEHFKGAENALFRAIQLADKDGDHYLLYACFTHLGFLQIVQGYTTNGISSFRLAKKEATKLEDGYLQIVIDVNLSDTYYRNNLYSQALFYIDQAQAILFANHINEQRIKNVIYNNKAEVYFRIGNADSLKKYNLLLQEAKGGENLYTFKKRTSYYVAMLARHYREVIHAISALKKDSLYQLEPSDELNLADAYLGAVMPDSAKRVVNDLLQSEGQKQHPEIKMHLYELLGRVAEIKHDQLQDTFYFKMALSQAKKQIAALNKMGSISSEIKIDEIQSAYVEKEENYKRERLLLFFVAIVSVLTVGIAFLLYRDIKRKKYYEKLLFAAQKEELAYINSHEVRRHVSNILGIVDTIRHSENKYQEYLQGEPHLLAATQNLDAAIKSISAKLEN